MKKTLLILIVLAFAGTVSGETKETDETPEHVKARKDYEMVLMKLAERQKRYQDSKARCDSAVKTPFILPASCAEAEGDRYGVDSFEEKVMPVFKFRLDHADECLTVYRATIDKKQSDLTQREADQIKTCKALPNMYPPLSQ